MLSFLPRSRILFKGNRRLSDDELFFFNPLLYQIIKPLLFKLSVAQACVGVRKKRHRKTQALCPLCFNWLRAEIVSLNYLQHGTAEAGIHFPGFIRVSA